MSFSGRKLILLFRDCLCLVGVVVGVHGTVRWMNVNKPQSLSILGTYFIISFFLVIGWDVLRHMPDNWPISFKPLTPDK